MLDSLRFLGLLNKGGNTLIGDAILRKIDKVKLIIIAKDASNNTKKQLMDAMYYRGIKVNFVESSEELGEALGFAKLSAVALTDNKASKRYLEKVEMEVKKDEER